jgi:hypothetical protein
MFATSREFIMARTVKGRVIKPPYQFIDGVSFDIEETAAGAFHGQLELPSGAAVQVGETYRVELADGRGGEITIKSYNDISTKGEFHGVGGLK